MRASGHAKPELAGTLPILLWLLLSLLLCWSTVMAQAIVMAQARIELRLLSKARARLEAARLRRHKWCRAKAALSSLLLWHSLGCGSRQPDFSSGSR